MKKVKIKSHIRNGKMFSNRGMFIKALGTFESKNIVITIEREKIKRSNEANRYYWGVVVKMIKMAIDTQTGDVVTAEDVHDLLKGKFNAKAIYGKMDIYGGTMQPVPQSTANLSVQGFATYTEQCRMWGNDFFNIQIPEPDERDEDLNKIDKDFEK